MRVLQNNHFDFLGIKWICIGISIALSLIGLVSLLIKGGPRLGIDFTGGAQIVYAFNQKPDRGEDPSEDASLFLVYIALATRVSPR